MVEKVVVVLPVVPLGYPGLSIDVWNPHFPLLIQFPIKRRRRLKIIFVGGTVQKAEIVKNLKIMHGMGKKSSTMFQNS